MFSNGRIKILQAERFFFEGFGSFFSGMVGSKNGSLVKSKTT